VANSTLEYKKQKRLDLLTKVLFDLVGLYLNVFYKILGDRNIIVFDLREF